MTREKLQKIADDFSDNSPYNFLGMEDVSNTSSGDADLNNYTKNNLKNRGASPEMLLTDDFGSYKGMRFFERPVFSITRADDPGFMVIKQPEAVGKHHLLPTDWLPSAKSVISFFLPYNRNTVEANKIDPVEPAAEWLYTRVDGQKYLLALGALIRDALQADGYKAVTPYTEDSYIMRVSLDPIAGAEHVPPYSTNWSERHVGVVTGLGTFGLSTNFISKAGCAGRLISVVTDWDAEPDTRDYDDWLGYCNRCGACIRRCPPKAHYEGRQGKDHGVCGGFIRKTCEKYTPRYGCGKCQSGLPCDYTPMKSTEASPVAKSTV